MFNKPIFLAMQNASYTWSVDLIAQSFPIAAIIVRTLLAESPSCAISRKSLLAETGLPIQEFSSALAALLAAKGVCILQHPSGLTTDEIVWMPHINSITQIGARMPWVTRWHNKAKFAKLPRRLQIRANLRATLRGTKKYI